MQPEVAQFSRVCSFDRAGTGWSEYSSRPRTSEVIVDELHEALKQANIPSPYILVGHSFGGANMQLYAKKYPEEVAGIILVDSAHEDQLQKLPQTIQQQALIQQKKLLTALSYLGLMRLLYCFPQTKKPIEVLPEQIRPLCLAQKKQTKNFTTMLEETELLGESLAQVKKAPLSFRDKPLIVISAGKSPIAQEVGLSPEELDSMTMVWKELQENLLSKSSNSQHIIAEKSGHMIPHEQPEIIVDAIQSMVKKIRSN